MVLAATIVKQAAQATCEQLKEPVVDLTDSGLQGLLHDILPPPLPQLPTLELRCWQRHLARCCSRRLSWAQGSAERTQAAISHANTSIAVLRGVDGADGGVPGPRGLPFTSATFGFGACLPVHVLDRDTAEKLLHSSPDTEQHLRFVVAEGHWLQQSIPERTPSALKAAAGGERRTLVGSVGALREALHQQDAAVESWKTCLAPLRGSGVRLLLSASAVCDEAVLAAEQLGVAVLQLVQYEAIASLLDVFSIHPISSVYALEQGLSACDGLLGTAACFQFRVAAPLLRFDCGPTRGVASDSTDHMTMVNPNAASSGQAKAVDLLSGPGRQLQGRSAREQAAISVAAAATRRDGSIIRAADNQTPQEQVHNINYARKIRSLNTAQSQAFVVLQPAGPLSTPPPVFGVVRAAGAQSAAMAADTWHQQWRLLGLAVESGVVACTQCFNWHLCSRLEYTAAQLALKRGQADAALNATTLSLDDAVYTRCCGLIEDVARVFHVEQCCCSAQRTVPFAHAADATRAAACITKHSSAASALLGVLDTAIGMSQLVCTSASFAHTGV